ncbi:Retrovirus-related Pol polyprotein from transposon TNT 1-94 [Vitis vinifera]|uniref:Retrovirus-related Pol polyprotein from transposon TNT 1-94 n=1 Tax=Vitis vinifera TaxID=29760 RepID=A0A438I0V4_VITVI|nr:Retrovirus-related Pol polyprotein from transposon TNT 1-94 [Vitis vinifera]
MIVEINTNTNVKTTDFKEEDKVATTQLHINQGQQTSPMWSATRCHRFKNHLLSVGQLQEKGYEIFIKDGVCRIQDEKLGLIAQVNMTTNRMFPLRNLKLFSTFKSFKMLVEKEAGNLLRFSAMIVVENNTSQEFVNFCENHGIQNQLTAAYSPQQNGVSERKNRTILNMVRTILSKGHIPRSFWPEAVIWSIHILNRSPTLVVQNVTPEEAWNGRKPSVNHFRIFGCIAYAHIPDQKRKNLMTREKNAFFLVFWKWDDNTTKQQIQADFDGENEEERQQPLQQQIPAAEIPPNEAPTTAELHQQHQNLMNRLKQQLVQVIIVFESGQHGCQIMSGFYKTKLKENGEVDKYKARLVAKGYKQEFGVDYKEVFAPVARHDTIRLVIALAAQNSWPIFQLDVKSAFLHGNLEGTDDLIFTGNDNVMFERFKKSMMVEFEMSDLGMMHYFLGIEVVQFDTGIFISQKKYVREILNRFQMKDCNPVSTPTQFGLKLNKDHGGKKVDSIIYKQIVGSLMYLTATRPDIMHSVSLISRYMENPTKLHFLAAKKICRYLQGTKDLGCSTRRVKGAVSWSSKKQPIVTLSTTEVEFIAATACACQAIWLRKILEELHLKANGSYYNFL